MAAMTRLAFAVFFLGLLVTLGWEIWKMMEGW